MPRSKTSQMIKNRDLIGDVKNAGSDIVKDVAKTGTEAVKGVVTGAETVEEAFKKLGTADISRAVTFSVGIGTPAKRTNIITSAE